LCKEWMGRIAYCSTESTARQSNLQSVRREMRAYYLGG